MARIGDVSETAKELNDARERLIQSVGMISFGFGKSPKDFVSALEQFIDATVANEINRRY